MSWAWNWIECPYSCAITVFIAISPICLRRNGNSCPRSHANELSNGQNAALMKSVRLPLQNSRSSLFLRESTEMSRDTGRKFANESP
ncbi:Uncharacterised protein [Mycobacteroides abscessus]|nr:Uncharacterised protein [Mycobacteroides abscessus]